MQRSRGIVKKCAVLRLFCRKGCVAILEKGFYTGIIEGNTGICIQMVLVSDGG